MWAILNKDNKVIGGVQPYYTEKEALQFMREIQGVRLIPMTIENSPAHIGNVYENGKFYSTKELING
jgi:hypothetical protein